MRGRHDRGPALDEPVDRRQRCSNAEVVGDHTVFHRHVEVGAHQHSLATHVAEIGERGNAPGHYFFFEATIAPVYSVVSIRRLL